ncbi:ATP synthase F1 subunit delta [Orenia marismortui]|uniref:ATP synthase subunit delta n=1 Tax=Orenia marismortui TaxID=46469 RepID=A0A4R8HQ99_9FIRM|nr:ATP synthase F1 subunit delta [Orenia marismortui]TDX59171.1 ATP synthase F1 subcomplex delta subunit [Orenia marismortui]
MLENQIAEKYAQALFELGIEDGKLLDMQDEFSELLNIIEENNELRKVIDHPKLGNVQKKDILTEVFEEQLSTNLLNFIKLLIDKGRVNYLKSIYHQFTKLVDKKENRLEVEVFTPIELSDDNKSRLKEKLVSITKKEVTLRPKIQPELLGGLLLKIGDKVIDGSLLNHLKNLENKLKGLEVSKLGVKINES